MIEPIELTESIESTTPTQDASATITADKIQAILAGPDYFTCERAHTRMKKAECIKRQQGIWVPGNPRWYKEIPPECQGCEQGRRILADAGGDQKSETRGQKEGEMEEKICKEPGCDRPAICREMCRQHYDKWRNQKTDYGRKRESNRDKICSEDGCNRPAKVKGMCKACYMKKRRKDHPPQKTEVGGQRSEVREQREIVLHFEEYPDLLVQLKAQAQEEFRSVELQSLFLLKKGLEENEQA